MNILIATDRSEFSRAAVDRCCEFTGGREPAVLKIISVYEAQVPVAAEPFAISADYYHRVDDMARQRAQDAAKQALDLIKTRCPETMCETTTAVELGRPAELLIETAKTWGADLIIMGSHGRGFWGRLTLGSVSDAVLHHAPFSVLIVRSQNKGE